MERIGRVTVRTAGAETPSLPYGSCLSLKAVYELKSQRVCYDCVIASQLSN